MITLGTLLMVGVLAAEPEPMEPFLLRERDGISNTFAKLAAGEPVTIGYLGASITNGAGASSEATKWRNLTFAWFQQQFPQVELTQIHAVSGGTGAQLGAARVGREYLVHDPDLMFVEFAVNDGGRPYETAIASMEGVVRQILAHDPTTDIVFIYAINQGTLRSYEAGQCPSTVVAHEAVAEHYGIPAVNVGWRAAQELLAKRLTWSEFSIDSVHPTDRGYRIYADLVIQGLGSWNRRGTIQPHTQPEPLAADNWERAKLLPVTDLPHSAGWGPVEKPHERHLERFPGLLKADQPGEWIRFRFRGTAFGLYDLVGPDSGMVELLLDGQPLGDPVPRWDRHCERGYRITQRILADNLPGAIHDVELRVSATKQDESKGTALRISDIILNGELIP